VSFGVRGIYAGGQRRCTYASASWAGR
jgi:hypothetical protein